MVSITYSRHAEEQISYRKISKTIIEHTIQTVDPINSRNDTIIFQDIIYWEDREVLLRIVCVEESNAFKVVTVYITSDIDRYR